MEGNSSKVDLPKGKISQIVDGCHSNIKFEESCYVWKIDEFDQICQPEESTPFETQDSAREISRHHWSIDFDQSPIFKRGETIGPASNWCLYLEKHEDHPGYLGIHLYLEDSETEDGEVLVGFVLSLVNVYGQDYYPKGQTEKHFQLMSPRENCGDPAFIKIQDLFSPEEGYLIQQNAIKIHLQMTIIYIAQEIKISEELPMHSIWGNKPEGVQSGNPILSNLWSTKSYADVTIECEGTEIPVHKNIICTASKVFDAMFSHHMTESVTNVVVIQDMDAITVNELFAFMYTGEVSPSYLESFENGQLLLNAAEKYDIMSLTNFCWAYLCGNFFSEEHIAKLILLAHFFSSRPEVKSQIYSYASRAWGTLKSREDIKQMIGDYPAAFMPILMLNGDGLY